MKVNRDTTIKVLQELGIGRQSLVAVEELAELQKAITKAVRYPEYSTPPLRFIGVRSNLVEEMADVLIIMDTLRYYYGITDAEIQDIVYSKQQRTEKRLKEGELR